jgi:hypothetical protein
VLPGAFIVNACDSQVGVAGSSLHVLLALSAPGQSPQLLLCRLVVPLPQPESPADGPVTLELTVCAVVSVYVCCSWW